MLASRERRETRVALTSTLHGFDTDGLTEAWNYQGLSRLKPDLVPHDATLSPSRRVTLDVDSSESPVHGGHEPSASNGHFESVCDPPLFVFNQDGDCLAATLRPGNVHSADGWDEVLLPLMDRYRTRGQPVVRAERTRRGPSRPCTRRWSGGGASAIRLPANAVRPAPRPAQPRPLVRYRSVQYQAAS